jgi:membrane protein involved in colicin uptake
MGGEVALAVGIGALIAGGTAVAQGQQQEALKAEQDRQRVIQEKQIAEEKTKMEAQQQAIKQQKTAEQIRLSKTKSNLLLASQSGGFLPVNPTIPTKNILGG